MTRCHICGQDLPHHDSHCRAISDLDRAVRVFLRLAEEDRNPQLRSNLARHLERHGRITEAA